MQFLIFGTALTDRWKFQCTLYEMHMATTMHFNTELQKGLFVADVVLFEHLLFYVLNVHSILKA